MLFTPSHLPRCNSRAILKVGYGQVAILDQAK
jgi:hypothetical protein